MKGGRSIKVFDFSYYNQNGYKVTGAAAFNHFVYTVCGGVQEYNDFIGKVYIEEFIRSHRNNINNSIKQSVKNKQSANETFTILLNNLRV